jgi:hypothetical protein
VSAETPKEQTVNVTEPGVGPTAPGVIVLAFNHTPDRRVLRYVNFLANRGVPVDFVVVDGERAQAQQVHPDVRVHGLLKVEREHGLRKAEWMALRHLPLGVLSRGTRVAASNGVTRPLVKPIGTVQRGYERLAYGFHGRAFMPVYRQMRPWLLSRPNRRSLGQIDFASADRIVAGDISAVSLGWRLAQRYPHLRATTDLDRGPYSEMPVVAPWEPEPEPEEGADLDPGPGSEPEPGASTEAGAPPVAEPTAETSPDDETL